MNTIDTNKLKRKYLFLLGVIFLIAFVLRVYHDVQHHNMMIKEKTANLHIQTLSHYQDMVENLENKYLSINTQFIYMDEISNFMKKRDREELYNYVLPNYQQLKKYDSNLYVMHFLDTKNTTILRMHKPEKYDDDLSEIRPIVAMVNKDKKNNFGFETGKNGINYRIVTPFINKQNEHLGVLEFGIRPQYFSKKIESLLDAKAEILIKTSSIKNLSYETEFETIKDFSVISNDPLFKNFRKKIDLNKKEQIIQSNNKTYILFNDLSLKDYKDEVIGKVIVAKDITKEVIQNKNSLLMLNSTTFLMLLVCYILIYIIFTRYSNKLLNAYENIQELEIAVETDALTQIYNRAALDSFLQSKVNEENKYAIIFFDIDHFKNINDNYGHNVGDIILKELTDVVSDTIRVDDFFARWGGEEFVIVLKTNSLHNALKITRKIKENINSTLFNKKLRVSCSFGVTMVDKPDEIDLVFKRADELLYEAKNAGRNCIKFST